jgi:ATP-dependent DNA helicase DinG
VEPIWVQDHLEKYIWSKYKYVILMSGTLLDKNMFTYLNGIDGSRAVYHDIESPFLVKNRPIYYMPVGKMTYNEKVGTWQKYIPWINKLIDKKYKNDKGIIHTNSFELTNWVKNDIKNKRVMCHTPEKNKDIILRTHNISSEPTILVSPSMTTGIDLSDDFARFQIMLKVPYPSLASQKNKMRMEQNKEWYSYRTIQTIIQMYGRAVRNYNDHAHFIILDGSFKNILDYSSKFIPPYILRAIKRVDTHKLQKK